MPHTPETSSTFAEASADSSSILDQLSEIQDEAKKNKVELTPEVQAYIRGHLEAVQQKLANGQQIYESDMEFIKEVRVWIKLLSALEARFAKEPKHYKRPEGIDFTEVKKILWANPALMHSLAQLENTGGEPDIISVEPDAFIFGDCSEESPNRRGLTYDEAAAQAKEFGVDMMSEAAYSKMQKTGRFDLHSGSWLKTDPEYRKRTGNAMGGRRGGGGVDVGEFRAEGHDPGGGWRGVLRVPKADH